MHTSLIVVKYEDRREDKPTPDEVSEFRSFFNYCDFVSEYSDERMKFVEMTSITNLLEDLNQKMHDFNVFKFDRQGFELGLLDISYELEVKDTDSFKDVLKKTSKDYPVAYSYSGAVYKNIYEFLDEIAEDGRSYEIVDIYNVHI